jgi:hypothetical protein
MEALARAGEKLLRAGGFGLVVLDLGIADAESLDGDLPIIIRHSFASPKNTAKHGHSVRSFRYG